MIKRVISLSNTLNTFLRTLLNPCLSLERKLFWNLSWKLFIMSLASSLVVCFSLKSSTLTLSQNSLGYELVFLTLWVIHKFEDFSRSFICVTGCNKSEKNNCLNLLLQWGGRHSGKNGLIYSIHSNHLFIAMRGSFLNYTVSIILCL